ncbi:pentatricopeptide repeat-containing protein At1g08070, chloroplastic-like [Magnolia sinica]|uniref:pentatricopeptide repeat-containing protein At1g08070, chloroplastic-like n=1 Tax=Magnolia sinica TaxID=86752 RepID=UPI002659DECA|nr:pentatricopeptide repeat-containing protein At1g08070, chloroplastic-like [Magnolia sinica]
MISHSKCIKNLSTEWLKNHCTTIKKSKQAHAFLLRNCLFDHNHAVSKLVSFLAISKSGDLVYARKIFSQIDRPDMFIWNTMIRGYAKGGNPSEAVSFYHIMIASGVVPDNFTFPFVLTACGRLRAPDMGRRFHAEILKVGLEPDVFVLNSLIQMYANCGSFDAALKLFDGNPLRDVVSWNAMIGGYVHVGFYQEAFDQFEEMTRTIDVRPDTVTMVSLVSACTQLGDLDRGRLLHSYSKELGLAMDLQLGNAVLDMYCKCGDLASAQQLFDEMRQRDVLTWTSLISGLASSGCFQESLVLFRQMQWEKIRPDEVTLVCVLSACAQTGALDQGKYIHLLIERCGINEDVMLETALVDMYAKCGRIDFALQVFDKMRVRNVFAWNAMIGGLAMHGHGQHAMALFEQMKHDGMMPDDVTFIGVLSACSHAGLVDEGLKFFSEMKELYQIQPRMEHYGCMVDLLCRARLVDHALAFIENMPIRPNSILWATLLGACRNHGDFALAEKIGKRVIELEPDACGRYVLLSNVYAGANQWDDALKIRNQMKSKGIEKTAGFSWIEVNGMVHQFVAGDRSHFQTEQIYMMVEEMCRRVKLDGHVSSTTEVLLDINEEEKEHSLYFHSEKLAIAFGLMNTAPGSLIRIVKNLRVCNDCHSFLKVVSKVFDREVVARDRSRFHHFREGSCSCMDFW